MTSTPPPTTTTTAAFHVQAIVSFAVSLLALGVAIWNLPTDIWIRSFLGLGVLYATTSAFTLAKTIRDRQESTAVVTRVDQARLDKLLTEHDPFQPKPMRAGP
jgi:hypothetical protein